MTIGIACRVPGCYPRRCISFKLVVTPFYSVRLIFWLSQRTSKTLHVVVKELFLQSRQQLGTDTKNVGINYSSVCASELLVDQGFGKHL